MCDSIIGSTILSRRTSTLVLRIRNTRVTLGTTIENGRTLATI